MTVALTPPLLPGDVDLTGMKYMPLYIERLRRSRANVLAASEPAAGFSMRLLWEESWWSVPAGSLENDELTLAGAARCSRADWKQRKPVALYGWVLCADGRYYHPVICEIAWETWRERLKARWHLECDRIKKANKRAIEEAQTPGRTRQNAETKPIPGFESWVTETYPASAERLFAAAATPVPAPAAGPSGPRMSTGQRGAVRQKPCDVRRTDGGSPTADALKRKDKDKIIPPTPLAGEAAENQETGEEWQRGADFAAFMLAVGQPDAPTATCWRAWLEVVRDLPEQRLLLAQVAAWRKHCAQQATGMPRYRPLGPARLLREGTLANFAEQAEALLSNQAASIVIEMAEAERLQRARDAWGDLVPVLVAVARTEAAFVAWFGDAWPEWEGVRLVIQTPRSLCREWIRSHFLPGIADRLRCEVDVRQVFGDRGKT